MQYKNSHTTVPNYSTSEYDHGAYSQFIFVHNLSAVHRGYNTITCQETNQLFINSALENLYSPYFVLLVKLVIPGNLVVAKIRKSHLKMES